MTALFNVNALVVQRVLELTDTKDQKVIDYMFSLLDTIGTLDKEYDNMLDECLRLSVLNQSLIAGRSDVGYSCDSAELDVLLDYHLAYMRRNSDRRNDKDYDVHRAKAAAIIAEAKARKDWDTEVFSFTRRLNGRILAEKFNVYSF